jgi:hypothetical protein
MDKHCRQLAPVPAFTLLERQGSKEALLSLTLAFKSPRPLSSVQLTYRPTYHSGNTTHRTKYYTILEYQFTFVSNFQLEIGSESIIKHINFGLLPSQKSRHIIWQILMFQRSLILPASRLKFFCPETGGSMFFRKACAYLQGYTASHLSRPFY